MSPNEDKKNSLSRTLSVDSLAPTRLLRSASISSLFRKRAREEPSVGTADSKSNVSSYSTSPDEGSSSEESPESKKRKIQTQQELEFQKQEKSYDEELPQDLRKYRPYGFRFNIPPKDRPIRIYADGVFDLFHLGHMRQLEQAKKAFENVELVCGIPSDVETHKRKGLTVLSDEQRCATLLHCKWVDEVIPDAPWCVTTDFLLEHKIDYVAHDDIPYASADSDDIYKPIKEKGMFLTTQRTEGISTSDIITKIIRDYDKYLMRNFARGATRKELNVSWLKKNELEFKKHISDFRSYWSKNKVNINNVSKDLYFEVREYLRGKKTDNLSLLDMENDDDSSSFIQGRQRAQSPATEFASKFMGNANKDLNHSSNKSFIENVKDWMRGDTESHDENDDEIENETVNEPSNKKSQPRKDNTESDSSESESSETKSKN